MGFFFLDIIIIIVVVIIISRSCCCIRTYNFPKFAHFHGNIVFSNLEFLVIFLKVLPAPLVYPDAPVLPLSEQSMSTLPFKRVVRASLRLNISSSFVERLAFTLRPISDVHNND